MPADTFTGPPQDQVYQPYESDGVLPYSEFSLRLSKSDIPYIVPILRSVSPARLRHMRLAMAKYYRCVCMREFRGQ